MWVLWGEGNLPTQVLLWVHVGLVGIRSIIFSPSAGDTAGFGVLSHQLPAHLSKSQKTSHQGMGGEHDVLRLCAGAGLAKL